jgi:hypothetical protein
MRNAVRFKSDKFNHTERRAYFINDCCFGDDVAAWLKSGLEATGYRVSEPVQEDWGWLLDTQKDGASCSISIGLIPEDETWQVIVEPILSLWERLRGHRSDDAVRALCQTMHGILSGDKGVRDITWLEMSRKGRELNESPAP